MARKAVIFVNQRFLEKDDIKEFKNSLSVIRIKTNSKEDFLLGESRNVICTQNIFISKDGGSEYRNSVIIETHWVSKMEKGGSSHPGPIIQKPNYCFRRPLLISKDTNKVVFECDGKRIILSKKPQDQEKLLAIKNGYKNA